MYIRKLNTLHERYHSIIRPVAMHEKKKIYIYLYKKSYYNVIIDL